MPSDALANTDDRRIRPFCQAFEGEARIPGNVEQSLGRCNVIAVTHD
jgi:hypothetical protein